jgi:plastocyanin
MNSPKRALFPVTALLGAAVVILPAVAGSETTPTITAVNQPGGGYYYGESHKWSPATATVGADGIVTISNPTEVNHGVEWVGGPATPVCSGVPTSTSAETSGKQWSGTCTFKTPGTYTFYCTVHGPEMTGTVTVDADGTVTTSMTTTTTTPSPASSTSPVITPTVGAPGTSSGSQTSGAQTGPASPLAGSASSAVELPAVQRGASVHGSLDISSAGAGGRLEVQLLAARGSLASAARSQQVQVGRLLRSELQAGAAGFAVPLDGRGKRALHAHRRLELNVRIVLTPLSGQPVAITRSVLVRR